MNYDNIFEKFEILEKEYDRLFWEKEQYDKNLNENIKIIKDLENKNNIYNKCIQLLQSVYEVIKKIVKARFERIISSALKLISPNQSFEIEYVNRRGKVDADFKIPININGKIIKTNPLYAKGGAVVDIVCLILRIIYLVFFEPPLNRILVLDESLRFLSSDNSIKISKFLHQICRLFDLQIIFITQDEKMTQYADKIIRVELKNGASSIVYL
ncbi:MAG: hypothetical protein ACTSVV_09680 [Promethearchaeota archaeon]